MTTPKEVLDLLSNAINFLPADGQVYQQGRHKTAHKPCTLMACEQVLVSDPGKGAVWRKRKVKGIWLRAEYIKQEI